MIRRTATVLGLVVVMTACGGPRIPLNIAMKRVPTDVVLGAQAGPPLVPLPVLAPVIEQALAPSARPTARPTTPPAPPACPEAGELAPITNEGRPRPAGPPAADVLPYRNNVSYEVGAQTGSFSGFPTTRAVTNVRAGNGEYFFDIVTVSLTASGATMTTTFHVVTNAFSLNGPGIYVQKETTAAGNMTIVRTWTPELKMLQFPAVDGTEWDAASADGTGLVQTFHGKVLSTLKVDACGTLLAAWKVEITNGRLIGSNTNVQFSGFYAFANQYGGLSVQESIEQMGTTGSPPQTFKVRTEATISREPKVIG